ncbi:hypothetical protein [Rubrivivax sp. JA1026]|uniref:hypothetical protein n=1 Tax=Rubrivivax sp. JA1026 TaxID=2710888 RepID=UPI0013E99588|nr:hypothetical protein [Rubrivivax sp. JA1026]
MTQRPLSRRHWLLLCSAALASCATEFKPHVPPVDLPLQDAPPGQALVYLLRAPHDSKLVRVVEGDRHLATLDSGTCTVISLPPGHHLLRTVAGLPVFGEMAPPLAVKLAPGSRRFFALSGASTRFVLGLPLPELETAPGSRRWTEVTELDAQGLMSIGRLVMPEAGAL